MSDFQSFSKQKKITMDFSHFFTDGTGTPIIGRKHDEVNFA